MQLSGTAGTALGGLQASVESVRRDQDSVCTAHCNQIGLQEKHVEALSRCDFVNLLRAAHLLLQAQIC